MKLKVLSRVKYVANDATAKALGAGQVVQTSRVKSLQAVQALFFRDEFILNDTTTASLALTESDVRAALDMPADSPERQHLLGFYNQQECGLIGGVISLIPARSPFPVVSAETIAEEDSPWFVARKRSTLTPVDWVMSTIDATMTAGPAPTWTLGLYVEARGGELMWDPVTGMARCMKRLRAPICFAPGECVGIDCYSKFMNVVAAMRAVVDLSADIFVGASHSVSLPSKAMLEESDPATWASAEFDIPAVAPARDQWAYTMGASAIHHAADNAEF